MKKADHLAKFLTTAVPGLAKDAERLFVAIDEGHIRPINGGLSYRWAAKVTVTLLDTPVKDLGALNLALLVWAGRQQPDLLRAPQADTAFAFNIEMLDRQVCDVSFQVQLDQLVSVVPKPGGGLDVIERDEPDPDPGFAHLGGFKPAATLQRLYLGDDLVLELPAP